jgi:hypothetical protein
VQLTPERTVIAFLANDRVEKLPWADGVANGYACDEFVLTPTGERSAQIDVSRDCVESEAR